MGLPQVSSSNIAEEVTAALGTFVQSPPHFNGLSSCDMSGIHVRCVSNRVAGEPSREADISDRHKDGYLNRLKITSTEKNVGFSRNTVRHVQTAASRIVGFESKAMSFSDFASDTQTDSLHSSGMGSGTYNGMENSGSLVRKRLLSPLNGMVLPSQFDGETIEIGGANYRNDSQESRDKRVAAAFQEHKKANFGNSECLTPFMWSTSSFPQGRNLGHGIFGRNSGYFTDGPLLENEELLSLGSFSSSTGAEGIEDVSATRSPISPIAIPSRKMVSSPLSLSPLGPKFTRAVKPSSGCRVMTKDLDENYLTLKEMELSLDGTVSDILSFQAEGDSRMGKKSTLDAELIQKFDQYNPETMMEMVGDWGQDLNLTSQCAKLGRTPSGLQVRRSLIGSFEESLLSGRLACGTVSQKIDGFLAVLNITGGSFSPQPKKLPFGVTSVDGDNFLLYYSSIDLSGHLPSGKGKCLKLKRSLSNDDSQMEKSRLRVPMKGRIQLTFMRQKVTLASSTPASKTGNGGRRDPNTNTSQSIETRETSISSDHVDCGTTKAENISLTQSGLPMSSPKANENSNSGVLRYALHLRFICPFPKKNAGTFQRCKSAPSSPPAKNSTNLGGERRFYLYNDMRVVFPQRHSDSDEGKLHVDYHYPSDPKYFDISD